jgi:hypothetical protein
MLQIIQINNTHVFSSLLQATKEVHYHINPEALDATVNLWLQEGVSLYTQ